MKNITLNTFVSNLKLDAKEINILHQISVFKVYEFLLVNNLSKELANLNASLSITANLLEYQNTTLKLIETNSQPTIISDKHFKMWNYILNRFSGNTKSYLKTMSINSLADFVSFDFESSLATQKFAKDSFQEIMLIQDKLKRINLVFEKTQVETDNELSEEQFKSNYNMVRKKLSKKKYISGQLKIQTHNEDKAINTSSNLEYSSNLKYKSLTNFPLWTGIPSLNKDIPAKFKPDFNVYEGVWDHRSINALKSLKLNTIREVLLTLPESLLELPTVGPRTLNKLRKEINNFIVYQPIEAENLDFGNSFSDFISMLCKKRDISEKHTNIISDFLCGNNKKSFTYADLGAKYSCSRERIRQIMTIIVDQIKLSYNVKEYIKRFNTVLLEEINVAGGIIDFDELSSRIASKMNWNASLKGYMLGQYFKIFPLDNGEEVVDDTICIKSPYRENEEIACKLQELVESTKKVSFNYLIETLNSFSKSLHVNENFSCIEINFSKAFIIEYAPKLKFKYDISNVYGLRLWRLKNGGLHKKVEAILFSTLKPMNPREVCDVLKKELNKEYDENTIHKSLISAPGCVLWGHNEFAHSSLANCSDDTLDTISSILSEKLTKVPFVSLKIIYDEFADIFEKEKIPNKYALGSVISLKLPKYYIERCRYVYNKKPKDSTSIENIIEKWVLSAAKPVKRCDLKNYLDSKIVITKELMSLYIGNIRAVISNASGDLIHIDNINLKKDNILELQEYISKELKLYDQIGVYKVFDEYQNYLAQYQISDSKMLYGVLKNYCSDKFSFPSFPNISSVKRKKAMKLNKILSKFILERGTIVLKTDCDEYFKQMGYINLQIKSRITREPSIFDYTIDSVVHKNTINWTESKVTNLLKLLTNEYSEAVSSGALFGDLEKFFVKYKKHLPILDNNIMWTERLLRSIIYHMPEVLILGNAKRAYIIKKISANNFLSLEDLVYYVVKNYFDGKCSKEVLNNWMRDNGIVRHIITPKMFSTYKKLIVNENEIHME
jgi:hypothetical protein